MAMRLTVQLGLHSRWCSVDEVGGVDGGREGKRGSSSSSTEGCSESGASKSDAGCVQLVRMSNVKMGERWWLS